jgi:hypothetical protein
VSERNTTAWSLSAARIPDILADAFRVVIVQNFEGIAVEDRDDEAMILRDSANRSGCQEGEEHTQRPYREATVGTKDEGHESLAARRIVGRERANRKAGRDAFVEVRW